MSGRTRGTPRPRRDEAHEQGPDVVYVVSALVSARTFLQGQLAALGDSGLRVCIVGPPEDGALAAFACAEGVEAFPIEIARDPRPGTDLRTLVKLVQLFVRLRPASVVASMPKGGLLGILAARTSGIPVRVYFVRGFRFETSSGPLRGLLRLAERLTFHLATDAVANSHSLARVARALSPRPVVVLGHGSSSGVDVDRFRPSAASRRTVTPARIGFVGRLAVDKGVFDLVEAVSRLRTGGRDVELELAGTREADDQAFAGWPQRPWLHERGYVKDMPLFLQSLDVLALPSYREGFPNVVLEASACEVPVVTTTATGARDAVVPGVTGLRVAPGDVDELATALSTLLDDPEQAAAMGRRGREWVVDHFDRTDVHDCWVGHVRHLLATQDA